MWLGHHGCGMMATDIKEAADYVVIASNNDDRLAGNICSDVLSGFD